MFRKKKFWIAATCILLAVVTVCMVGCSIADKILPDSNDEEKNVSNAGTASVADLGELSIETMSTETIKLYASAPTRSMTRGVECLEQTITAVVSPSTAENQLVDWAIGWEDGRAVNVHDYVTLVPNGDGALSATVICYAPFTGNAIITVTTRQGGFTAECMVIYEGKPTQLNMNTTATYGAGAYHIGPNSSYVATVTGSNMFGSAAAKFNNYNISVQAFGTIKVGTATYSGSSYKFDNSTLHDIELSSIVDNFVSWTVTANGITFTTNKAIEAYVGNIQSASGTRFYTDKYYSTVSECYLNVTVTEPVTGISATYKFEFDSAVVTEVNLPDVISF